MKVSESKMHILFHCRELLAAVGPCNWDLLKEASMEVLKEAKATSRWWLLTSAPMT